MTVRAPYTYTLARLTTRDGEDDAVRSLTHTIDTVRSWSDYARLGFRLGRDLPPYLRDPLTVDAARQRVHAQLQIREERFLAMADRNIFGAPASPYQQLLAAAGCERGDLQRLVRQDGLEGALRQLAAAGVYVTFDEMKGRREAVRGSQRFTFSDRDFDNPSVGAHYIELTGGTRGRPSEVRRSLGTMTDQAASFTLALAAHGVYRPRVLFWTGASPSWAIGHLKLDNPIERWYYPIAPLPLLAQVFVGYLRLLARLGGGHLPAPHHVDLTEPERIARWLAARAGAGRRTIVVNTATSSAVRAANAAHELGLSLEGVLFQCRSEPLTESRRQTIERSGAYALADYATVELSSIAYGCANRQAADDLHLHVNRYAVVERERPAMEHGPMVRALLFTALSLDAQKVALNVETGDSALVQERACGCDLDRLGLRTHLSEVRSFEKLSSEGTSFARSNVVRILEESLPARFGGMALDYQLVEEEASDGSMLLVLRIAPTVGPVDEEAVRGVLLTELGGAGMVDEYHAALLQRAASVVVRRLPPLATTGGKVLPFHLERFSAVADRPGAAR